MRAYAAKSENLQPRLRVAAYVLRQREAFWDLLVFEQAGQPGAGLQVPAGGVHPGESLVAAVLREVGEETGLHAVAIGQPVAVEDKPHPVTGQPRRTTYFVAHVDRDTPDGWEHRVSGDDGDAGMVFVCRFMPLPLRQALADDQDRWLGEIDPANNSAG
ncbi:NUDIX domain-containing protein [Williamsia sp. CHRR-6]|uniref:NUDIX hydrolase n=1 Tax=Williamsia sp. CHRR-6 TaxID=2835871 RepID=UPI001BD96839|nr:NUDIX domain-containing protein [Williamsia sp. CHRR-6]MBT0567836.1 NUDIX domain-containing protein [Williamsia sp. CHRR-6]